MSTDKSDSIPVIALLGNPNSGKTTLFNALTGSKQHTGNWAGVTVDLTKGSSCFQGKKIEIVDLPGTYSLTLPTSESPQDEYLASLCLRKHSFSLILNVVDAQNLVRNLYLTLQCLEQGQPVVVALNRVDLQGGICTQSLAKALGCPVVAIEARSQTALEKLKLEISHSLNKKTSFRMIYPEAIESQLKQLQEKGAFSRYQLLCWLEGETPPDFLTADILAAQAAILQQTQQSADALIASTRYDFIERIVKQPVTENTFTQKVDYWFCHRTWGLPLFLAVMYSMFFFVMNIGGALQPYFELAAERIFVDGLGQGLTAAHAPAWLIALLSAGLGKGIATVLTFVPVIGAMFLALAFLEDSGYMARAAFVMDRFMRAVGLPGKSFVPMIIGFGCNVPAIMGTRTLDNKRDRILSVMMSPFMSCGARLAIFSVFVAAFFEEGGQNVVFLLYVIGILMAVLTGLLLKKTILRGDLSPFILEIPPYQWPHWHALWPQAWHRLKRFVLNAGKLILPVCVILRFVDLSVIGQHIVPIFAPMGIEAQNWPAAVGLLTGILAKEVVIGTLSALYAPNVGLAQAFGSKASAFAYLIFVLLYFPCVSAVAAMVKEVQKGWTLFSICWTTGLAYVAAVFYYQVATFSLHPAQSIVWISLCVLIGLMTFLGINYYGRRLPRIVPTPIRLLR